MNLPETKGPSISPFRVLDIPGLFLLAFSLLAVIGIHGVPPPLVLFAGFAILPGLLISRKPQPAIYKRVWNITAFLFIFSMVVFQFVTAHSPQATLVYICIFLLILRWFTFRGSREHLESWCLGALLIMVGAMERSGFFGILLLVGWGIASIHFFHLLAVLRSHPGTAKSLKESNETWSLAPATFRTLPSVIGATFILSALFLVLIPRTNPPERIFPHPPTVSHQTMSLLQTGFSETVSLTDLSTIHQSDGIALRIINPPLAMDPNRIRFRVSTLDHFDGWNWRRTAEFYSGQEQKEPPQTLYSGPPLDGLFEESLHFFSVRIVDHPGNTLPVPQGFRFFSGLAADTRLQMAPDGRMTFQRTRPITRYDAWSARHRPGIANPSLMGTQLLDSHLDIPENVRGDLIRFARDLIRDDLPPMEQAERIQNHFRRAGTYTLDLEGIPDGPEGLARFHKHLNGHCELYATSMALVLRHAGIPSRLATGYLGAEPLMGFGTQSSSHWVIPHRSAHAWVEAWIDGDWMTFDPTPSPVFTTTLAGTTLTENARSYFGEKANLIASFVEGYDQSTQQEFFLQTRRSMINTVGQWNDGMWLRMGDRFYRNIKEPEILTVAVILLTLNLMIISLHFRRRRILGWLARKKLLPVPSHGGGTGLLRDLLVAIEGRADGLEEKRIPPGSLLRAAAERQSLPGDLGEYIAQLYDAWRYGEGGREVELKLRAEIRHLRKRPDQLVS